MDQLLRKHSEFFRQVLELIREGYKRQEIAKKLGVSESTIRRAIRTLYPRE